MSSTVNTNLGDLAESDKRHHLHPLTNPVALSTAGPDMIIRAEGVYLYTSDGRKILDVSAGLNNVHVGYGNRLLCEAASGAMQQLSFAPTVFGNSNPWIAALSSKLATVAGKSFECFLFGLGGSDAVESSIKIALRYWRLLGKPMKRAVISQRLSYHGNTLFAASLSGLEAFHTQFGLPITDMIHYADAPYRRRDGDERSEELFGLEVARALENQILTIGPENIAAFVGEPIQIGGGTLIPPKSYWPEVQRICNKYELLLIADEVVTGFGKTGSMFGFQSFDFEPDLFAMAKGLSSGYFPISAVGLGTRVSDVIRSADEPLAHVFSNSGHPVGAAIALANINYIEENGLVDRVRNEIGPYFSTRLNEMLEIPRVQGVRSLGVLGAVDFDLSSHGKSASQDEVIDFNRKLRVLAWKRGLAARVGGSNLCLPMIITNEQIDEAIGILKDSIVEALFGRPDIREHIL